MSRLINVTIDRPIGYKNEKGTVYPINYGYVKNIIAGDGEEQDAYVISNTVNGPIESFEGVLIAIVKRHDDNETKWIISAPGETYTTEELSDKVHFIEQYFDTSIYLVN
ncbi:inorganic pyrophosphatase [Vagococcus martis]|uniref:inorganic diphosphatase n=1 Tax=Vagococcus martis TaxID=1768210 RepID=A0A1V4DJC9_9ENTE|nr:inorganic diphosphatase [Vagococcus martis]OPF88697.1 inorganic pyrophosphatase [Vagococcus martis]